ncbi:unnamed protein product [Closterium sp. NIES-53]
MLALCREHRLEHRTKHIALRYFLARELQQRGQLRLAYVASEANTADIFTKALALGDHQRFCTMLACFALLDWSCDLLGLEIELEFWPYDCYRAAHPQLDEIPLHSAIPFDFCSLPLPFPEFHLPLHWHYQGHLSPPYKRGRCAPPGRYLRLSFLKPVIPPPGKRSLVHPPHDSLLLPRGLYPVQSAMVIEGWLEPERVVVASAGSGRSPAISGSVTVSKKPPLPSAPKPPPSVLESPSPPAPAPPAAEPHPPAAAAPHARVPAGPAPVTPVAPVAPVESPVPVVVVDAPPGAPILDVPLVSVALPAPVTAVGSSPHAVSTTTGGPGPGEVERGVALSAPVLPTAATSVPPPDVQAVPDTAPLAAAPLAQRPPSPDHQQHRPHSPAAWDERETTRRRHDSPRRRGSQANWAASRGGCGGWWGGAVAVPFPLPIAPSASTAAHGNRMRQPWVPPVAGMEFVTAAGGLVTAQYPSLLPVAPAPLAVSVPLQSLVGPLPSAVVPEASLGQLWRLSEGLRAVHLIQVYGHAALSQGAHLDPGPRDECMDAADQLAELLAPVLATPARGGVAGVGQLGTAVRGLRRLLHAGSAVDLIGATTVVVRELHCSLMGLLAVLDADQM